MTCASGDGTLPFSEWHKRDIVVLGLWKGEMIVIR